MKKKKIKREEKEIEVEIEKADIKNILNHELILGPAQIHILGVQGPVHAQGLMIKMIAGPHTTIRRFIEERNSKILL